MLPKNILTRGEPEAELIIIPSEMLALKSCHTAMERQEQQCTGTKTTHQYPTYGHAFARERNASRGNKKHPFVLVARRDVPASNPAIPEQNLVRFLPVSAAQCHGFRVHEGEPGRSTQSKMVRLQLQKAKPWNSSAMPWTKSATANTKPIDYVGLQEAQLFYQNAVTKKNRKPSLIGIRIALSTEVQEPVAMTVKISHKRRGTPSDLRVVRKSSRDSCLSGNVSTRQHISKLSSVCSRHGFPPMALASRSFFTSPMRPYVRIFSSQAKPGSPFCCIRSQTCLRGMFQSSVRENAPSNGREQ